MNNCKDCKFSRNLKDLEREKEILHEELLGIATDANYLAQILSWLHSEYQYLPLCECSKDESQCPIKIALDNHNKLNIRLKDLK